MPAPSYIVIYSANCQTFGCFSIPCETAFVMRQYFDQTLPGQYQIIMTTYQNNLDQFRKIHGKEGADDTLSIYGKEFPLISLETLIETKQPTAYFIKMGCGARPNKHLVQQYISITDATKVRLYSPRFLIKPKKIGLGIGKDRLGIPHYHGKIADIEAQPWSQHLQGQPYGLIYFNPTMNYEKAMQEYFTLTKELCKVVVVVGDFDREEIIALTNNAHTILFLKHISHTVMLALMKNAITLIGVTGTSSLIEAMLLGKLPFYQYDSLNQIFVQSILDGLTEPSANLFRLLVRNQNNDSLEPLIPTLAQPSAYQDALNEFSNLMRRSCEGTGERVVKALMERKRVETADFFPGLRGLWAKPEPQTDGDRPARASVKKEANVKQSTSFAGLKKGFWAKPEPQTDGGRPPKTLVKKEADFLPGLRKGFL